MRIFQWITVLAAIAACFGCSGKGGSPVVPPGSPDIESSITSQINYENPGNRYILGLWEVYVSADRETIETVPVRSSEMHLNLVNFLENVACTYCVRISDVKFWPPDEMEAYFQFRHPFYDIKEYTIFDVRVIIMSDSDYEFPESGRSIAWSGNYPVVLNPDGYTHLFNPVEYPESSGPPVLTYNQGKFSFGDNLTATLNAFLAFDKDEPRRMLYATTQMSSTSYRKVWLSMPDGPFSFGYAIDCSWAYVEEVDDPVEDFPPEANCPEPYEIITWLDNGLTISPGSEAPIYVEVFDHQNPESIQSVEVEAPDLFEGTIELAYSYAMSEESWMFEGVITNERADVSGEYPLLIRAVSNDTDPNLGQPDAWDIYKINLGAEGWGRTWGGYRGDYCLGVTMSAGGNLYVTGYFTSTMIDLDPGIEVWPYSSEDDDDVTAYLSEFNSDGEFQRAMAWAGVMGSGYAQGCRIKVDDQGNIIVAGRFKNAVDFDPGPGTYYLPYIGSYSSYNLFVVKYDPDFNLIWAMAWPLDIFADTSIRYGDMILDHSGNVYLAGYIGIGFDFDPGLGTDIYPGGGFFLINITSSGQYNGTVNWGNYLGSSNPEIGHGLAIDETGNLVVAGGFKGVIDFDPGPGEFELEASGDYDAFLNVLNQDGQFITALSWGGDGDTRISSVAMDSTGNLWVVGTFSDTVDFDPGPGILEFSAIGHGLDFYLSKFSPDFEHLFSLTWGSEGYDYQRSLRIEVDPFGNAYVCGNYPEPIDLDPGPGIDFHSHTGFYLTKFDPSGNYLGSGVWQELGSYSKLDLTVDSQGNPYLCGDFYRLIDMNPSPGTDYRTTLSSQHDAFLLKLNPDLTW